MSIYEKLKSPLENDESLIEILQLYCNESYRSFYQAVVDDSQKENFHIMREEFEKYIKLPAYQEYLSKYLQQYGYDISDNKIFSKVLSLMKSAKEKFEEIEKLELHASTYTIKALKSKGDDRYKQLEEQREKADELKSKITDVDKYYQQLYLKCYKAFVKDKVMGFHVNPQNLGKSDGEKEKSDIKFYINVGQDTYKFASLFKKMCEERGINYYFKVVNPEEGDHNRCDKMCIYSTLEHAETFMKILNELKHENPQMSFRKPPVLAASLDDWLGIGTDGKDFDGSKKSSNQLGAIIIEKAIKKLFKDVDRSKLMEHLSQQPQMLSELRKEIKQCAKEYGIDEEIFGISRNAGTYLKTIEIENTVEIQESSVVQSSDEKKTRTGDRWVGKTMEEDRTETQNAADKWSTLGKTKSTTKTATDKWKIPTKTSSRGKNDTSDRWVVQPDSTDRDDPTTDTTKGVSGGNFGLAQEIGQTPYQVEMQRRKKEISFADVKRATSQAKITQQEINDETLQIKEREELDMLKKKGLMKTPEERARYTYLKAKYEPPVQNQQKGQSRGQSR